MTALFHHDTVVAVLGSGSKGNCTYIGDGRRGVLIDCGISTKQIRRRLAAIGMADAPIDAVFVTHEHSDHVGAAAVLDRDLFKRRGVRVPFYMSHGTARGLRAKIRPTRMELASPGTTVQVGSLQVSAHPVPHDTPEPLGFVVQSAGARIGVVTDLGRSTRLVEQMLSTLDVAVLEFNHDAEMLRDGPYPWQLKQRIRGHHGHLSNEQSAELLARGASSKLAHLVLAHLSDENNTPDLALEACHAALHRLGRAGVQVQVGRQDVPVGPLKVSVPEPRDEPKPQRNGHDRRARGSEDDGRQATLF